MVSLDHTMRSDWVRLTSLGVNRDMSYWLSTLGSSEITKLGGLCLVKRRRYAIRRAVERHRHLLEGDVPFVSINDHKSLKYVFDKPSRVSVVSVAARDRLRRWIEYLQSFTFGTIHSHSWSRQQFL